jgi:preprotein translocase subunit SecG
MTCLFVLMTINSSRAALSIDPRVSLVFGNQDYEQKVGNETGTFSNYEFGAEFGVDFMYGMGSFELGATVHLQATHQELSVSSDQQSIFSSSGADNTFLQTGYGIMAGLFLSDSFRLSAAYFPMISQKTQYAQDKGANVHDKGDNSTFTALSLGLTFFSGSFITMLEYRMLTPTELEFEGSTSDPDENGYQNFDIGQFVLGFGYRF